MGDRAHQAAQLAELAQVRVHVPALAAGRRLLLEDGRRWGPFEPKSPALPGRKRLPRDPPPPMER